MNSDIPLNFDSNSYGQLLESIKTRIYSSQHRLAMYVNSELLFTYWNIGHALNQARDSQGWGAKVVEQLAKDLKSSFPTMKGLSKRNLQYMMRFATEWSNELIVHQGVTQIQTAGNQEDIIVPQPVAQFQEFEKMHIARIPWGQHRVLLDKLDNKEERLFYCEQIISNNWSRSVLLNKIDQGLYKSKGQLANNFIQALPPDQSTLVKETFKDPYFFDFLQLGDEATEREIEVSLTTQIGNFLLELGAGFAYMGRQYKLEIGGQEYYLDLLFFHTTLNCYVNIELKIDAFKPGYAGKSQFYLSIIDDQLKLDHHNSSVGIILCKEANNIIIEYTLKQTNVPLGIAQYKLVKELPEQLQGLIPSIDQLKETIHKMKDE